MGGQELVIAPHTAGINNPILVSTGQDFTQSFVRSEKLTDLIGVIAVQAEIFMASRFKDYVWPILLEVFCRHSINEHRRKNDGIGAFLVF